MRQRALFAEFKFEQVTKSVCFQFKRLLAHQLNGDCREILAKSETANWQREFLNAEASCSRLHELLWKQCVSVVADWLVLQIYTELESDCEQASYDNLKVLNNKWKQCRYHYLKNAKSCQNNIINILIHKISKACVFRGCNFFFHDCNFLYESLILKKLLWLLLV